MIYSTISQKVVDGFRGNLVDTLAVRQGRNDSILVLIQIRIWIRELFNFFSDSSSLKDQVKNEIYAYFKNVLGPICSRGSGIVGWKYAL